jgi:hypothetical protein
MNLPVARVTIACYSCAWADQYPVLLAYMHVKYAGQQKETHGFKSYMRPGDVNEADKHSPRTSTLKIVLYNPTTLNVHTQVGWPT